MRFSDCQHLEDMPGNTSNPFHYAVACRISHIIVSNVRQRCDKLTIFRGNPCRHHMLTLIERGELCVLPNLLAYRNESSFINSSYIYRIESQGLGKSTKPLSFL